MPEVTHSPITPSQEDQVSRHLKLTAGQHGWDGSGLKLFFAGAKMRPDGLYLHAEAPGKHAWERAERLQLLENDWNDKEPRPEFEIVLVPVGVSIELVD